MTIACLLSTPPAIIHRSPVTLLAKTHIFQHPLTPDSSDRLLIVKTPSRTVPAPVCSPIRHCTAPSRFRRRQVERHLLWLVGDASADVDTRFHRRVATHMRRVATHMPRTSTPNPIPITKPKKSCINVVIARSVDPEKYVIQPPRAPSPLQRRSCSRQTHPTPMQCAGFVEDCPVVLAIPHEPGSG